MTKYSNEEFIKKAREIHGNKYDYSKTEYVDAKTKVCIICPEHGEFWQRAGSHLAGRGCNKCARPSYDTDSFIKCAKQKHGDKYDYSKTKYVNTKTPVIITCPIHGDFKVTPNSHLDGVGCRKCANKYNGYNGAYTTEEFVALAKKKYGDKFDYTKTDLEHKDENGKITVTCKDIAIDGIEYGDYNVNPVLFLHKEFEHKKYTTENFIRIANYIHCNKYDYSKTDLEHKHDGKIIITCPEHGDFKQYPTNHLKGDGCVLCQNKKEGLLFRHLKNEYTNLIIEKQKKFHWLGKQSLDFYLPEHNIAIEYQGRQHFEPVDKFGGKKEFEKTKNRDKRKRELCKKNGIKLLYFSFDEKITTFLGEKVYHNVKDLQL